MSGAAPVAQLSDEQRLDWLQLIRSDNIGPRTFRSLVNRYGGASAALRALPDLIARHAAGRNVRLASRDACLREMEATARFGARFVALGEADYPPALREIDSPPPLLCVKGDVSALARPMVAMVGSRNASAAGLAFTERLTHELAGADFVIASGLARGVDQRAHRASLRTGTVAVLAGGLDRIYPPEHEDLARDICARGVVMSEMPLGWEPRGRDFPRRNRIVSGLALGTVVVEAARRSGSLITARFANEQGREVFAVPGSPLDPRAEGTNDLLRQGATLCTSAADVLDALRPVAAGTAPMRPSLREDEFWGDQPEPLWDEADILGEGGSAPLTSPSMHMNEDSVPAPTQGRALEAGAASVVALDDALERLVGPSPVTVDDLVRASGASAAAVQAALFEMEMRGLVVREGNLVARRV
ncbi:MAG: dprA [Hyphomicrobiales bacterium]|nr:dprA [Hyphomicrobiales bacterium]